MMIFKKNQSKIIVMVYLYHNEVPRICDIPSSTTTLITIVVFIVKSLV